jgi:hypothetical protein
MMTWRTGGLGVPTRLDKGAGHKGAGHMCAAPAPSKCGFRKVTKRAATRSGYRDRDKTDDRGNKSSSMSPQGGGDTGD